MIKIVNSLDSAFDCYQFIKEQQGKHKYLRVNIQIGSRTHDQNGWWNKAYSMISKQDEANMLTVVEVRRYCKFTFGLPILFADHRDEAERFWKMCKSITYEERLLHMDYMDVTSHFTVKEGSQYIESLLVHYQHLDLPEKVK